jgi:antitoxin CptB
MISGEARIKILRWKSRRGMKELDVLLELFLKQQEEALKAGQWPALERLLEQEDDVFFEWVSGRNLPHDPELLRLIDTLTDAA